MTDPLSGHRRVPAGGALLRARGDHSTRSCRRRGSRATGPRISVAARAQNARGGAFWRCAVHPEAQRPDGASLNTTSRSGVASSAFTRRRGFCVTQPRSTRRTVSTCHLGTATSKTTSTARRPQVAHFMPGTDSEAGHPDSCRTSAAASPPHMHRSIEVFEPTYAIRWSRSHAAREARLRSTASGIRQSSSS